MSNHLDLDALEQDIRNEIEGGDPGDLDVDGILDALQRLRRLERAAQYAWGQLGELAGTDRYNNQVARAYVELDGVLGELK